MGEERLRSVSEVLERHLFIHLNILRYSPFRI